MLMLSPILMSLEDVSAESAKKKMKKQMKWMEKMGDCASENLEKTLFYSEQGKIYIGNPECDPDKQYKYDKLNQMNGINEYEDRANFIVGEDFDDDDDDDKDKKKKDKKDRD